MNLFLAEFSHLVPLCYIGQPIKITNQPDHDSVILASWLQLPIQPTLFKCPLIKLSNQSVGTQTFNRPLKKKMVVGCKKFVHNENTRANPFEICEVVKKPFLFYTNSSFF